MFLSVTDGTHSWFLHEPCGFLPGPVATPFSPPFFLLTIPMASHVLQTENRLLTPGPHAISLGRHPCHPRHQLPRSHSTLLLLWHLLHFMTVYVFVTVLFLYLTLDHTSSPSLTTQEIFTGLNYFHFIEGETKAQRSHVS